MAGHYCKAQIAAHETRFYMNRELNENLSGNEVYNQAYHFLVMLKNLCSKPYCQRDLNSSFFSYKSVADFGFGQRAG